MSEWSGKLVSFLALPLIAVTCYNAVLRYVFNKPTIWADETTTFLMSAIWLIGGAYVLLHRSHVKIDLLYDRLSPRSRAILDLITSFLFFAFLGALLWQGWEMALTAVINRAHSPSPWGPPVYPIKMIVPAAAFLLLLQGLAKFIRDLTTAFTGRVLA